MNKKIKLITCIALLALMCLSLVGCGTKTLIDDYIEQGYTIKVSYEANGGKYFNRDGITIVDMFNPSDYEVGGDGMIHIKLLEPTDPSRPKNGSEKIFITKTESFLAGWYKTRFLVTNEKGKPVDENGQVMIEQDGYYFYETKDGLVEGVPAYTYADPWNFETDTIDYDPTTGEVYELSLYAGWVKYYTFDYYCEENGQWVKYGTTNFDYKTTNQAGSITADYDNVYLPRWNDGQMDHNTTLSNKMAYTFPKKDRYTFVAAYEDEDCTKQIVDMITHPGTLDYEHGVAVDRVKNIYVKFEAGEKYKISTADQLVRYAKSYGEYEIEGDLDFKDQTWPSAFTNAVFTGKIFGKNGATFKLSNISANYSAVLGYGGLFGKIGEGAEIKNVTFENATLNISSVGAKRTGMTYGLFSGEINEKATLTNVSVSGTLKLGVISLGADYAVNLVAPDADGRITNNGVKLVVYGNDRTLDESNPQYCYLINPEKVVIDAEDNVTLEFYAIETLLTKESYNIN